MRRKMENKLYLAVGLCAIYILSPLSAEGKSTFTYMINNQLEEPFFTESIELEIVNNKPLIYYMEQTVLQDPKRFINFTVTFKPVFQGYYVNAINDQWGYWFINETWWAIWNSTGLIPLGVSKYIPVANDPILFNFTQGWIDH